MRPPDRPSPAPGGADARPVPGGGSERQVELGGVQVEDADARPVPGGGSEGRGDTGADADLLARLRDLCLVELDVLLEGRTPAPAAELLDAHADELAAAVRAARARMSALVRAVAAGPDPLGWIDADARLRAGPQAREAGARSAQRLAQRAAACRALVRLDELTAELLPRLFEAERRRHGHV